MPVEYRKMIYRDDLKNEPDTIFLFGDNLQKIGYGGQAGEMRDEPNAIGIPTKRFANYTNDSFYNDGDFFEAVYHIDIAFSKIPKNAKIVIPEDGLGTGIAELPQRAPMIYNHILDKIKELENYTPKKQNVYRLDIEKYNPWTIKTVDFSAYSSSKEKCRNLIEEFYKKTSDIPCEIINSYISMDNDSLYEDKEQYQIKGIQDDLIYYNCYIRKLVII